MHLRIHSHTRYEYEGQAVFSPHLVRLFPRPDQYVQVLTSKLTVAPEALTYHQRDQFDNHVVRCIYQKPGDTLEFDVELELTLRERNAFDFLVDLHAIDFPFQYRESERMALVPYLTQSDSEKMDGGDLWPQEKSLTTVQVLTRLNEAIFTNFRYESREEGEAMLPAETLAKRSGSCRDFSRLAASLLRSAGIAVRLVSGYAVELGVEEKDRRADGSLHAWIEAYIPGAGWLGINPTSGNFADHRLIATAVGLHPSDIAPTPGTVTGKQLRLDTTLTIVPIE